MPSFARARGLGKWGEKHVIAHLRNLYEVKDVSEVEEYQKKGIDVLVSGPTCDPWTADIKMDRMIARTGNLFIETMSSEKVMGNMVTSSADYFLYLDPFNCKLYTIDRKKMLDFWVKNQKDIEVKKVGNKDRLTQGFLITTELITSIGLANVEDIYIEGARNNKIEAPVANEPGPLPF